MLDEYRCERCNHLLFRGSLKLLVSKKVASTDPSIEPKCAKCGLINCFVYEAASEVAK